MKFLCRVSREEFDTALHDGMFEYNRSRARKQLHLRTLPSGKSELAILEGHKGRLATSVFHATVRECNEGVELTATVAPYGRRSKLDTVLRYIARAVALLSTASLVYLLTLGVSLLYGAENLLIPLIMPLFIVTCTVGAHLMDVLFRKRRFARFFKAYLSAEELAEIPRHVSKKKRSPAFRARFRHLLIWRLFYYPVRWFLRIKVAYKPTRPISHKRKFIMISNHVTDYDMLFMAESIRQQMYFVMSEHALRGGFASKLLAWAFAPIGRSKGSNASSTVMEILRHARAGHNVGIFAEGFRTMSGENTSFSEATGAMVKKMGSDLITYRVRGGYYCNPNWSHHIRKGKVWGEIVGIYPAEEVATWTVEQINEVISRDIYENAHLTQQEYRIPYKTKKGLAEHLEFALLVCPHCHGMATMHSEGDRFWCDCGLSGTYNEYGDLVGEDLPYHSVTEWSAWQAKHIESLPDLPEEEILLSAPGQSLIEIDEVDHTDRMLQVGKFVQTAGGFSVGSVHFDYSDIAYFDIVRHGFLLFTTVDKHYYQIKSTVHFPGLLAKMLWQRYGKKHK